MTDDILNTTQNPDELRRLATALLTAQAWQCTTCACRLPSGQPQRYDLWRRHLIP
ncbi:hypothetical protein GTJ82_25005 [Escherichia coli]|nr:hypothetical protein [Escherichia coli]EFH6111683.1 hypothetical protein [Escherichia coli]MTD63643.1 hypothetical protein [Escherichia coli]MTD67396.1 hypothetical protein [Escherichia coli]MTD73929.1 hypothetical protein [Escherichia coli]